MNAHYQDYNSKQVKLSKLASQNYSMFEYVIL